MLSTVQSPRNAYFFEKAANNQPRIVVGGVDFSSYDMLTDKKSIFHVKV